MVVDPNAASTVSTGALDFGMTQEHSRTASRASAPSSLQPLLPSPELSSSVLPLRNLKTPQRLSQVLSNKFSGVSPSSILLDSCSLDYWSGEQVPFKFVIMR